MIAKIFFFTLIILSLTNCATKTKSKVLTYSADVFTQADFIPHNEKGPMKSWLGMNLTTSELAHLKKQVEESVGSPLTSRGEFHITVITPVEYDKALSAKLSMNEIQSLAQKANIQSAHFKPVCVGQGHANIDGKQETTYFVVVASEDLFKIRQQVAKAYALKGGDLKNFNADLYFPHITLGFSKRDLHYEDGVIKDERSCIIGLKAR